jgi:hypothetical protein
MWRLKACPKCCGDLYQTLDDQLNVTWRCLQCGHSQQVTRPLVRIVKEGFKNGDLEISYFKDRLTECSMDGQLCDICQNTRKAMCLSLWRAISNHPPRRQNESRKYKNRLVEIYEMRK